MVDAVARDVGAADDLGDREVTAGVEAAADEGHREVATGGGNGGAELCGCVADTIGWGDVSSF